MDAKLFAIDEGEGKNTKVFFMNAFIQVFGEC